MIAMAAWWGLGFAALVVSVAARGWHMLKRRQSSLLRTGQVLSAVGTVLLWTGLVSRAIKGRGWPIVTPADMAMAIALLLLLLHTLWSLVSSRPETGLAVTLVTVALLTYALSQFPQGPVTSMLSKASMFSDLLYACGGSLLAMAAAASLTYALRVRRTQGSPERTDMHVASCLGQRGRSVTEPAAPATGPWPSHPLRRSCHGPSRRTHPRSP